MGKMDSTATLSRFTGIESLLERVEFRTELLFVLFELLLKTDLKILGQLPHSG